MLIFSASTQTLDILEGTFKTVYPNSVRIDGATNGAQRQKNVDKFNSDPQVFLAYISTKAGGTGLNLQAANRVVIFDVNWNPTFDAQACDLGVPRCCGAFTPSTHVVSRRGGRGWFLFRF